MEAPCEGGSRVKSSFLGTKNKQTKAFLQCTESRSPSFKALKRRTTRDSKFGNFPRLLIQQWPCIGGTLTSRSAPLSLSATMARPTRTTRRPMVTRSMTGPVTRSSLQAGGRRTRSSGANQWGRVILCKGSRLRPPYEYSYLPSRPGKKRSRPVVQKRSSTARSASVEDDPEPPFNVVNSRNRCPGKRTLRQGGTHIGDPAEEHESLLPGPSRRAAGTGARQKRPPPSQLKTLEKRLDGALSEIADLTNLVNEFKSNNAKAQLKYLEEYFTCILYVAVFHYFFF